MQWPEKPTCHVVSAVHIVMPFAWREPREGESFRTCSYCGCIHPEDLIRRLTEEGQTLTGSDWKYGWPHKLYVRPDHAKWYTEHLADEGYDDEARARLLAVLKEYSDIEFTVEGTKIGYKAPHPGYQKV